MKTATICTIGDEILIGQIVDTNSSHIARALQSLGIRVLYHLSIADDRDEILGRLSEALDRSDIVIATGGLGPTRDDITKDCLRILSGSEGFRDSEEQYRINCEILAARGIGMMATNRAQSQVPDRCEVLPNHLGTAPGMVFRGLGCNGSSVLYSLPGVPFEALGLLGSVMGDIRAHFDLDSITHRTIVTFGIPESVLAERIRDWEDVLPQGVHLAYLPNATLGVRLRLTEMGGGANIDRLAEELKALLGDAVYGEGDDDLPTAIGRLLLARGKTMSAAESCTGGRISALMTAVPGCSAYYYGSVTSYDNSVKVNVLGVREQTLREHGAVSEECIREMAEGVLRRLGTDYSVATSGIAGPSGGTPEKPVGMAWIAAARRNSDGSVTVNTRRVQFRSNRATNIERFASNALNLLRLTILEG